MALPQVGYEQPDCAFLGDEATQVMRRTLLLTGCVAAILTGLSACAAPAADAPSPAISPSASAPPATTSSGPEPEGNTVMGTTVRITVDGHTFTAQLADNPTARNLIDELPLTLAFRDFNGVEKIAKLPGPLTTGGVPAGADPDINDIGYYAPSGDLVFYYGDVGYWNGIVRLGRFDGDIDFIQRQSDGFEVTIERG
jgi:hypothetical protein